MNKILQNIPRAIRHPIWAWGLLRGRLMPGSIVMNNPEAYVVVGSWTFGKLPRERISAIFPGIEGQRVTLQRTFDRTISTSLSDSELIALAGIVRHSGAKNILEIGTFDGNTALNIAANTPDDARITTLDLPSDWDGQLAIEVPNAHMNVTPRSRVGIQYRNSDVAGKVTQAFGDSATIDWRRLPGPFDLIFIDGNHYYDYVRKDTENALAHVRPGGLIVWHDYGMIQDVSKAVDETAQRMKVRVISGTRLAVGFP